MIENGTIQFQTIELVERPTGQQLSSSMARTMTKKQLLQWIRLVFPDLLLLDINDAL